MSGGFGGRPPAPDGAQQHRDWLRLVEVTGPFLSLPVLRRTWPTLDALEKAPRDRLRVEHATWQADLASGHRAWIRYVLADLLGWGDALHESTVDPDGLEPFTLTIAEHDTDLAVSFALAAPSEEVKPGTALLLGVVCPPGQQPTARIPGQAWAATPVDRLAMLCRHHEVELGLATDGRWWALVWAPRGGVTTTAVFDAVSWPEAAERDVVRAWVSLLSRTRFLGVPEDERLTALLRASLDSQEEITEVLGVQVRKAVELLVAAIGHADIRDRELGGAGLRGPDGHEVAAHDVYRGAVAVMMRIVFILFAEERKLLPADNELYARAYSAGRLRAELEQQAIDASEEHLEHSFAAWHRLLALFNAVYQGIQHPRLTMHAHDGSLFDPTEYPWLPLTIDDRTVLHMLRAVQYVEVGKGKNREGRTLSFRALDVEQIGYVYEGLLSFEGFRAPDVTVGLIGTEGLEDEVPLADLESVAASTPDLAQLAAVLADRHKDSKIGSAAALAKKLAPLDAIEREEARKRLLAVTGGDYPLAERLLPFAGIIRADLRGLPVVILPGALFVTESALRRNTGTHYTPRFLAEQVVEGALEPLVYRPGPLQTADKSEWRPVSSEEILALKVADIAMGSAAFLVAAARYLGGYLVEAWSREGNSQAQSYLDSADGRRVDADEDPVIVEARRQVIEHCLYGVDINPMAVEMAKLSLWLVSMDPHRPFTFLDDRLVSGDSLLGITSLDQLEYMHLDPKKGKAIHERSPVDFTTGVRSLVAEVADLRRRIADVPVGDDPFTALATKRALLAEANHRTEQARLFADLTVGAALANIRRGDSGLRDGSIAAASHARQVIAGGADANDKAETHQQHWLATDHVAGSFERSPMHWPLTFPEVFERAGFDAIVGNPPFLGGKKISGASGSAYREYLVDIVGHGVKGNADLIAYFEVRAHDLLNGTGQTGLIATNTLAQGDTREVGLDQIVAHGVTIRQSVKSKPWPSKSAALEYCAVWTSRSALSERVPRKADGVDVGGITPSLDPESRTLGNPHRILANQNFAFIGSYVLGIGFVIGQAEAAGLVAKEPRNRQVISPYLNGQDLNSRADCTASRWIINFADMSYEEASIYGEPFGVVSNKVRPQRDLLPDYKKRVRENWWKFEHQAKTLYQAIEHLERVIVIALVSKTVMPVVVQTGQVFAHKLGVFASDDAGMVAMLSSAPHYLWAVSRSSTMKADLNYSLSDVFETLSLPSVTGEMRQWGERLDGYRREVMLSRQAGLTATYNLVFDPDCHDEDIVEIRRIHREIDEAVCRAYGWDELLAQGLDHGFHKAGAYTRYTVGPAVAREMVDLLLELNHRRYADEVAAGLHDKKKGAKASSDEGTLF